MVLVRLFVHNGLAFYLTWLSIATLLNFATYIAYHLSAAKEDASTIALFFLLAIVVVYFVLENFVWQRFLLNVFTPYVVLIIALIGSLTRNYSTVNTTRNNIITLVILLIIVLFAFIKCIMYFLYKTIFPIQKDNNNVNSYYNY